MIMHAFNPSSQEAETEGSVQVQVQPCLQDRQGYTGRLTHSKYINKQIKKLSQANK